MDEMDPQSSPWRQQGLMTWMIWVHPRKPRFGQVCYNVGKTIINHPFGNGLYHLFMVIWGMAYCCSTHIKYHPHSKLLSFVYGVFFFRFYSHHFGHPFLEAIRISGTHLQAIPAMSRRQVGWMPTETSQGSQGLAAWDRRVARYAAESSLVMSRPFIVLPLVYRIGIYVYIYITYIYMYVYHGHLRIPQSNNTKTTYRNLQMHVDTV